MKIKKRFLSILLSLALVMGLISGMTLTAYADGNKNTGGVWVCDRDLTNGGSVNVGNGTVLFDANTHTLTLENISGLVTTTHEYGPDGGWAKEAFISVYNYNHYLTIIIKGNNTFNVPSTSSLQFFILYD